MYFVLKPVSGDDLNIGVFGGASRQKLFFELRICSTALGRTIHQPEVPENMASLSELAFEP
jgi:hypothetical protein